MGISFKIYNLRGVLVLIFLCLIVLGSVFDFLKSGLIVYDIILSILFIYYSRYSRPVMIFFIFSILYLLPFYQYYWNNKIISVYTYFNNAHIIYNVIIIHSVFLVSILSVLELPQKRKQLFIENIKTKENSLIYFGGIIVMLFIYWLALRGNVLSETGKYGSFKLSTLYEYLLIVFLVVYTSIGKNKIYQYGLYLIALLYCYKAFQYGSRVTIIQMLLMLNILFLDKWISNRIFWISIIVVFLGMQMISVYRLNVENFTFSSFFKTPERNIIVSNQGDVGYGSMRLYGMVDNGDLGFVERAKALSSLIVTPFVPSSFLPDESILAQYKNKKYPTGGGSLISMFAFVYLSYLGVVAIGILLGKLLNNLQDTKNQYFLLYAVMVLVTFPRWFAYSPFSLIKMSIWVLPLFWVVQKIKPLNIRIIKRK